MVFKQYLDADIVRSIPGTSITSSYQAIGIPLTSPIVILVMKNTTNQSVFISENGVDDHYELLAGTAQSYPLQSNRADQSVGAKPVGMQFQVKSVSANPTLGKIIIEGQKL